MKSKKIGRNTRYVVAVIGFLMAGVSIYLTDHFYAVQFPTNFKTGSFCNISQFWNCDSAAFSPLGSIFSVPTSLFGLIFGLLIFLGACIEHRKISTTNFFLSIINLFGCVVLCVYSLLFLGGLCPGCTLYYLLSLILVAVFVRAHDRALPVPHLSVLLAYAGVGFAFLAGTFVYNSERNKVQEAALAKWVHEIEQAPIYDDRSLDFSMALVRSHEKFADAPLRITIFSDFQCPFCKILGQEIEKIAPRYRGNLNVRYLFYPLDAKCNKKLSSEMHPFACAAARLSYCAKANFVSVHDDIYEHQNSLSEAWLLKKSEELGLKDCYQSLETQLAVNALIESTEGFHIEAAPHTLINGRKISGLVPSKALITLLDSLLKQSH